MALCVLLERYPVLSQVYQSFNEPTLPGFEFLFVEGIERRHLVGLFGNFRREVRWTLRPNVRANRTAEASAVSPD